MSKGWVQEMISRATPTKPDNNVISMEPRDPYAPPKVVNTLYTEILKRRDKIDGMRAAQAQLADDIAKAADAAEIAMSKAGGEIAREMALLTSDQERWITITRGLGIDIQDETTGEQT